MKANFLVAPAIIASALVLTGCGGDSDSSGGAAPSGEAGGKVGVFSDSPVAGVRYRTEPGGRTGFTSAVGEYDYEDGDTVTFSIGGVNFPPVSAKGRVTPLDMGGEGADLASPVVLNVIRLLQTLDADGDPENGITISEDSSNTLADTDLAFDDPAFETQAEIALDAQLVSEEQAANHFKGALKDELLGSWVYREANGNVNVLTFFARDRYVIAHSQADDGDQPAGSAEYGVYSWDPVSGAFSVDAVVRESDNSGGLYNADEPQAAEGLTLSLDDATLTLALDDGEVVFDKVTPGNGGALAGTWRFFEPREGDPESGDLLTFINATDYVLVHSYNSAAYEGDAVVNVSSEWGTYNRAADGTFTVSEPMVETDGPAGLYDVNDDDAMQVDLPGNGELLLSEQGAGEVESYARVGRFEVTLRDFEGDTRAASVKRDHDRFENGVNLSFRLDVPGEGNRGTYDGEIAEQPTVTLNADGGGTLDFGGEVNTVSQWSVSNAGVLRFTEYAGDPIDSATWTLTPITGSSGDSVLVQQSDLRLSYIGRAAVVR